ncbi:ubiquinone/menaquinone biosynthesis C-methylase UbiE [Melghirimyces profundicolus]|uniref:Ubiquinone/menaquinone biosynthesis C-methylase UbiE n=1 Tax=Melghirimyces profundicolus TaxID=1242148 RepID=A0A2T6BSL9_9BACL|nr:class I SAM-dependent methyltransferase [Melghirimyces profundicolus]PTX59085.1 ubiquinone/menaquinone biosynthesis C-methylase UbiE [Melghirimyces profundicolus]
MPWYEESFGEDYLLVYRHRNRANAEREIRAAAGWLDLKKGDRVLDLCCGTGRHSISLDDLGLKVTGIDLSPVLLKYAEKASKGRDIRYVRGDMRDLPFEENEFAAVFNLFTSFGYFIEDGENEKVLSEIHRVTQPGGRFLIDFLNRNAVEKNLVPESVREENGVKITERRWIDGDFVRKKITLSDSRGQREYRERVKMYDRTRMVEMMEKAGLTVEGVRGDFEGSPYSEEESPRMIFYGRVNP